LAGATEATAIHGELEIISLSSSLSGSLSADGAHLNIAAADSRGAVIGGHLCAGSLVPTTSSSRMMLGALGAWLQSLLQQRQG